MNRKTKKRKQWVKLTVLQIRMLQILCLLGRVEISVHYFSHFRIIRLSLWTEDEGFQSNPP